MRAVLQGEDAVTRPQPSRCCSGCAFDGLAGEYDEMIGWDEFVMGMGLLRWWMLRSAKGQVRPLLYERVVPRRQF